MNPPERISQEIETVEEKVMIEKITKAINDYESITGKFVKIVKPERIATNGRMGSEVKSVKVFTTMHIRDMLEMGLTIDDVTDALVKECE